MLKHLKYLFLGLIMLFGIAGIGYVIFKFWKISLILFLIGVAYTIGRSIYEVDNV